MKSETSLTDGESEDAMTTCLICSLPIAIPPANVCPACSVAVRRARLTGETCVSCGALLTFADCMGTSTNTCLECQREEFREWRNLTLMENLRNFPAAPVLAEPTATPQQGEGDQSQVGKAREKHQTERPHECYSGTLAAAGTFNPEP